MDVDDALRKIGQLGRSQCVTIVICSLIQIYCAYHQLGMIFLGLQPEKFNCIVPVTHNNGCYDGCLQYEISSKYNTAAKEWSLICDRESKVELAQSVYMFGVLWGALFFGPYADRYGRKKAVLFSLAGFVICATGMAAATSYSWFLAVRIICGFFNQGAGICSFTLLMEVIGPDRRALVGILLPVSFAIGISSMAGLAWLVPAWRPLQFMWGLCGLIFFPLPCILQESPRWLLSKGRVDEAEQVLLKMARTNGASTSVQSSLKLTSLHTPPAVSRGEGICSITGHPRVAKWTAIMIVSWCVNSAVYYALTLAAGHLGGSPYISVALSGVVEIPAYIFLPKLVDRYGRRPLLVSLLIMAGVFCAAIYPVNPARSTLTAGLATAGKLCISGSFALVFVHSSEVFPTSLRNSGLGVLATSARVGGMASPFILLLGAHRVNLQYLLLGLMSAAAGLLCRKLPETGRRRLAENLADIPRESHLPGFQKMTVDSESKLPA